MLIVIDTNITKRYIIFKLMISDKSLFIETLERVSDSDNFHPPIIVGR